MQKGGSEDVKERTLTDTEMLKQSALHYSEANNPEKATEYILKYIEATKDISFINDHLFHGIKNSSEYLEIKNRFKPDINILSLIYLFAGFLGFFIFIVLGFKKGVDRVSTLLIGFFVLFHSVFLLHFNLYVTNAQYYFPHSLFVSTTFSFLYGPLLYFYFRRTIFGHDFKKIDLLHLVPSLALLLYILPYYSLSGLEKFQIMLDQGNFLLPGATVIIIVKIVSMTVYGGLILKMYNTYVKSKSASSDRNTILWQRNILSIYVVYVAAYMIYAATITQLIQYSYVMHFQMLVMAGMVFYVSYIAYVQPEVFKGNVSLMNPVDIFKYRKSRLTPSYSLELKDKLVYLMENEKIFKMNSLNLELLAEKMETNRHNASQVINEHFNMNFFEFVNSHRIEEAIRILKNDKNNTLNIIEVAYEVGFNNKVTFNKSFKKILEQTPTQYLNNLRAVS